MKQSEITQMQANFEAWVGSIDERIHDWLMYMSYEQKKVFDYSIESLDEVERYLINNYTLDDLKDEKNKLAIDRAASYVYKVFMKHLPVYHCFTELKDQKNLLFNLPTIDTIPRVGHFFSPYFFLPRIINLKKVGDFRFQLETMIKKYNEKYSFTMQ